MCLMTGSTPPASRPSQTARPSCATRPGSVAVGAVADHRVRPGNRQVEHRQAIDGDAEPVEVVGDQPRAEPGRHLGAAGPATSRWRGRRDRGAIRRPEPGHPAALLVDQHRRIAAPDAGAQRLRPARAPGPGARQLRRNRMKPEGSASAKKAALGGGQPLAGAAQDNRARPSPRRRGCQDKALSLT